MALSPAFIIIVREIMCCNKSLKAINENNYQAAALMQGSVRHCAAIIIFAAHFNRITKKYFEKGKDYVHIEVGHAAQNVLLQSIPLQIGAVTVGAFIAGLIKKMLHLSENEDVLYLLPLGKI